MDRIQQIVEAEEEFKRSGEHLAKLLFPTPRKILLIISDGKEEIEYVSERR
jgi:hypothetical protein